MQDQKHAVMAKKPHAPCREGGRTMVSKTVDSGVQFAQVRDRRPCTGRHARVGTVRCAERQMCSLACSPVRAPLDAL